MIIIYNLGLGEIIIAVDFSFGGWDIVLMQIANGKRCFARYENGIWSPQE